MYYIYEYVDPITNIPFYVGKGSGNRRYNHLRETEDNTENRHKYIKINALKQKGLKPIINIIEADIEDEETAYNLETEYILKYGRIGHEENGTLTNVCLDNKPPIKKGEANGMYNKQHTEKAKQLIGSKNKGNKAWNKGIPQSQEVKDAVSKANKGKTPWNKGKERTEEDRLKLKQGWAKRKAAGIQKKIVEVSCLNCRQTVHKCVYTRLHKTKCNKV